MAFDMDDAVLGTDESTDEESRLEDVLTRTESQLAKQVKVQKVAQRMQTHQEHVQHLKAVMKSLPFMSSQSTLPEQALKEVEQHQRQARNIGEDLLEDILALDSLTDLFAEDRLSRKVALGEIDALIDEVDGVKTALLKHRREFEALLETQQKHEKQQEVAHMKQDFSSEADKEDEEDEEDTSEKVPRFPSAEAWANLKLPLRLQYQNLADGYVGVAELPGLAGEDIKLKLEEHGSLLRISGLILPKTNEIKALDRHILNKLGRPPAVPEEYLLAGRGRFGCINEALRLPKDVDVRSIEASCRDGVLQLTLPRQRQRLNQPSGFRRSPRAPIDTFGPFHGRGYARQPLFAGGW